jgi:Rap1a immunity proteins
MKTVTAAALVCVLSIAPAFADIVDGNKLWRSCDGDTNTDKGLCYGYAAAVVDSQEALLAKGKYLFCVPATGTLGQLTDVVKKHLRDHPEDRHHPATFLVIRALMEAFPCKN